MEADKDEIDGFQGIQASKTNTMMATPEALSEASCGCGCRVREAGGYSRRSVTFFPGLQLWRRLLLLALPPQPARTHGLESFPPRLLTPFFRHIFTGDTAQTSMPPKKAKKKPGSAASSSSSSKKSKPSSSSAKASADPIEMAQLEVRAYRVAWDVATNTFCSYHVRPPLPFSPTNPHKPYPLPLSTSPRQELKAQAIKHHQERDTLTHDTQTIQQATVAFQAAWVTDRETLQTTRDTLHALKEQSHALARTHHQHVSDCQQQLRSQILGQKQEVAAHKIEAEAALLDQWQALQPTVDGQRHEYRVRQIQAKARQAAQASLLLSVKKEHAFQITAMVQEYEAKTERVLQEHHRQVQALHAAADVTREAEKDKLAGAKAAALDIIKSRQHEEVHDLKAYYNKALRRQCLLLDAGQAKLNELRRNGKEDDKHLARLVKEHDQALAQPLARATHALAELQSANAAHQEERRLLQCAQATIKEKEGRVQVLTEEIEELECRLSILNEEPQMRRRQQQSAVLRRQQRADLVALLREQDGVGVWGA